MALTEIERQALRYVINTDFTATVAEFDDDNAPIGPMLRAKLMPSLMYAREDGRLMLSEAGMVEAVGN